MMEEALVSTIVEMVAQRLRESGTQGRTLVLLEGMPCALDRLDMQESGYDLLDCERFFGEDRLRAYAPVLPLPVGREERAALLRRYERVETPSLSLPCLAKLANLIVDGPLGELVYFALAYGKPLFLPPAQENAALKALPAPLAGKAAAFTEILFEYGVQPLVRKASCIQQNLRDCRLITERLLQEKNITQGELLVARGTVVTPLANDYLREKRVLLRYAP